MKAILNVMADETDTTTYAHSEHKGSDVLMSFLTPASVQFFLDSSPAVGLNILRDAVDALLRDLAVVEIGKIYGFELF